MVRAVFVFRVAVVFLFVACPAVAQDAVPSFPRATANWLNSSPITEETLKGKGALLYFFEESCPRCQGRWPEILAAAKKLDGQPAVFIAVNSGSSSGDIAAYAHKNGIFVPVIVDPDRSFEQQCDVGTISLQNIYQLKIITAAGQMISASSSDLEGAAERALDGAHWNVDPSGIPEEMIDVWRAVEFGNFPAAVAGIRKNLRSRSSEFKDAAEKLNDHVLAELDERMTLAADAERAQQAWDAYRIYSAIQELFKGYDIPEEVGQKVKELASGDTVKTELAALKRLNSAKKALESRREGTRKRGRRLLESLVADSPDTEAATQAQQILQQLGSAL